MNHWPRRFKQIAAVAAVAAFATITAGSVGAGAQQNTEPLDILLTNDDGAQRGYINIIRDKLCAAGHNVTVVAPSGDQSGNGGRFTTNRDAKFQVTTSTFTCGTSTGTQHAIASTFTMSRTGGGAPYAYNGPASPVDSVKFGLGVVFAGNPPDLVISGANPGQNMSSVMLKSGTVGAAQAAADMGIPAIALSVAFNPADSPATGFPQATVAAGSLGDWTVALIAQLQQSAGRKGPLLDRGLALNVNYPTALTNGLFDVTKVGPAVLTVAGDRDLIPVGYAPTGVPGEYTIQLSLCGLSDAPQCTAPEIRNADTTAIDENKISVTPIDGDITVLPPSSTGLNKVLNRLNR